VACNVSHIKFPALSLAGCIHRSAASSAGFLPRGRRNRAKEERRESWQSVWLRLNYVIRQFARTGQDRLEKLPWYLPIFRLCFGQDKEAVRSRGKAALDRKDVAQLEVIGLKDDGIGWELCPFL